MTRATLFAVTDKKVINSIEFNGDGYPDGRGIFMMEMLENIKDESDFCIIVNSYIDHLYTCHEDSIFDNKRSVFFDSKKIMNMNGKGKNDYYGLYFSDWIFIKNISSNPFGIKSREGKLIILATGEQVALNFGRIERSFKSVQECRQVHDIKEGYGQTPDCARENVLGSIREWG